LAESQGSSTRTKKVETTTDQLKLLHKETVEVMLKETETMEATSKPNLSILNQLHPIKEEITKENNQLLLKETTMKNIKMKDFKI